MEPSGRNRWQPMANARVAERAQIGAKRCRGLRNGKEGVDGSSPSEGSAKFPQISSFRLPEWRRFAASTSTERPPTSDAALGGASKASW
jgi:hypothetical protein